jgi:ABC-type sugar transport system permease subunit
MNWFKNLKIKAKLLLSFVAMVLMTTAIMVFTIYELRNTDSTYYNLINFPLEMELQLRDMDESVTAMRFRVTATVVSALTDDFAEARTHYNQAVDKLNRVEQLLVEYERLIRNNPMSTPSEEQSQLQGMSQIKTLLQQYRTEVVVPMGQPLAAGDVEGILTFYRRGAPIANSLGDVKEKEVNSLSNYTDEMTTMVSTNTARATNMVIGLTVVIIGLSLLLAFVVASVIQNPLSRWSKRRKIWQEDV